MLSGLRIFQSFLDFLGSSPPLCLPPPSDENICLNKSPQISKNNDSPKQ